MLKGKYFHDQDFMQTTTPDSCSHGWRGILIGRDLLKEQLGGVIGNGEKVHARDDDWISLIPPQRPIRPAPEGENTMKISELISNETKEWDGRKIERRFPLLRDNILSIKTSK